MSQKISTAAGESPHADGPRPRRRNGPLVWFMAMLAIAAPAYNFARMSRFKAEIRLAQADFIQAGGEAIADDDHPAELKDPARFFLAMQRAEARRRLDTAILSLRTTFIPLYTSLGLAAAAMFCWVRGRPGARDRLEGHARGIDAPQVVACTLAAALAVGPLLRSDQAAKAAKIQGQYSGMASRLEQKQSAAAASLAQHKIKLLADFEVALKRLEDNPGGGAIDELAPLVFSTTFPSLAQSYKQPFARRMEKVAQSVKADQRLLEQVLALLDRMDEGAARTRLAAMKYQWVDVKTPAATDVAIGLIHQREVNKLAEMLKRGLDPNSIQPQTKRTLLYEATASANSAAVTLLLDHAADPNQLSAGSNKDRRMSPLHMASAAGSVPLIDLLISRKADVNIADTIGATPLHLAVARGVGISIEALLRHNANVNAADVTEATPLDYLYSNEYTGDKAKRNTWRDLLLKHEARSGKAAADEARNQNPVEGPGADRKPADGAGAVPKSDATTNADPKPAEGADPEPKTADVKE